MDRQLAESFRIHAQDGVMAYAAFPTMRARVGFAEVCCGIAKDPLDWSRVTP